MENSSPAASQQPPVPPLKPSKIGIITVVVAIILFVLGLVLYISSATEFVSNEELFQVGPSQKPSTQPTTRAARVEGQIVVKFKPNVTDEQITNRLKPLNASIRSKIDGIGTTVLTVPPGQEDAILKELSTDPLVQYAEPDYIYYLQFIPNDASFANQWGLINTGQTVNNKTGITDADIDVEQAWDVSRGTGVKVAILDSGIDLSHPELASKVVATRILATTLIDDAHGHGTHVAGILAANTNNSQGIAGVCPECQLMIGKIANDDGSVPTSAISAGVTWAADNGAQVINMSIAGPSFSQAVQDAVNYAWGKNIVIVAAAGNQGTTTKTFPGGYENVIAVASTNSKDVKSTSSNHGTWVHVAAPGDNIYSTLPTTENSSGELQFGFMGGTSMASPAVSGIAALVWKTQFGTSNEQVVRRILDTAEPISGTGTSWIHGRVNAAKAVGVAAPTPTISPFPSQTASVSITPEPTSVEPSTVVPTFVCGGSVNSICPTTPPGPTVPNVIYVTSTPPVTNQQQPNNSPFMTPIYSNNTCDTATAIAHDKHKKKKGGYNSKHKNQKEDGAIGNLVEFLLRLLLEILNLFLRQSGTGQVYVTNPNTPCPTSQPIVTPVPSGSPTVPPSPTQ